MFQAFKSRPTYAEPCNASRDIVRSDLGFGLGSRQRLTKSLEHPRAAKLYMERKIKVERPLELTLLLHVPRSPLLLDSAVAENLNPELLPPI